MTAFNQWMEGLDWGSNNTIMTRDEKHKAKVRANNARLKAARHQARIDKGLPPIGSATPEHKKEAMRNYMRERRAKWLEENKEQHAAELAARKAKRAAETTERRKAKQLIRNEQQKERRRLAKLNGDPDKRTKAGRAKPHYKQLNAKPKPIRKERKLKVDKPLAKAEPVQIPTRQIDLTKTIPVRLNAKTTIYVRPGTDIQSVINKFNSRKI